MKPLKGTNQAVLYLDFDGTLHHEAVYWDIGRTMPYLRAPARYTLFQHAALLDQMLAPHPSIAVVLSTSWVRHYGIRKAAKELPAGLRGRVIGTTHDARLPGDGFVYLSRGEQVAADVERRHPGSWLALDDDPIGWPDWTQSHLLLTDPYEGISPPELAEELRRRLAQLASAPVPPRTSP